MFLVLGVALAVAIGLAVVANQRSGHRDYTTIVHLEYLSCALEEYRIAQGEYPTQALRIALGGYAPPEQPPDIWQDQWGNDFRYQRRGKYRYHFYSLGPDGKPGTGDEIGEHRPRRTQQPAP